MSNGAEQIAAERERQVSEEGYTAEHDEGHAKELSRAAQCYVGMAIRQQNGDPTVDPLVVPVMWPWHDSYWHPTKEPTGNLVKAGALIAAAIDSLRADVETGRRDA